MKNGTALIAVSLLTLATVAFVGTASAEVILSEDWESQAIDPGKWNNLGSGMFVYNLALTGQSIGGATDFALFVAGGWNYTQGVMSTTSFNRGDNLRCTFKMLRDDAPTYYSALCGPWASNDGFAGTYPALENIEAGISRTNGDGGGTVHDSACEYIEDSSTINPLAPIDSAFYNAILSATNKENALTIRVMLGDSTGAEIQWSTDEVNFNSVIIWEGETFEAVADTIGDLAGTNWIGNNRVSGADPVWLFFGGGPGGGGSYSRFIVDDIVVETGSLPVEGWKSY